MKKITKKKKKNSVSCATKLLSLYFRVDIFVLMHHLYAPQKKRTMKKEKGGETVKYPVWIKVSVLVCRYGLSDYS